MEQQLSEQLVNRMSGGIVQFIFRKVDGTERTAFGTVQQQIIVDTFGAKMHKLRLDMIHKLHAQSADAEIVISPGSDLRKELEDLLFIETPAPKEKSSDLVSYFDMEKQQWRSFKKSQLVKVF